MKKKILNPFVMFLFGLLIGFISRLLDIFTTINYSINRNVRRCYYVNVESMERL